MIAARNDDDLIFFRRIDEAIFWIDPPAPVSGKATGQRLWFSWACVSWMSSVKAYSSSTSFPAGKFSSFCFGDAVTQMLVIGFGGTEVQILKQVVIGFFRHDDDVMIVFSSVDDGLGVVGVAVKDGFHIVSLGSFIAIIGDLL